MATHKHIDRICTAVFALCLLLTVLCLTGGTEAAETVMGYEERLFSTDKVHTIDIVMDDWEGFLSTAQSEEYSLCDAVIDGETINNVGIRGKGNTSLSTVASMDSDRYSFKIEFDQYDTGKTYHGLDKLSLNNLIQDNTCMKDYLTYRMMAEFGAAAPLCSYVWITVNGEDWGLYLAVEGVEDSFLQRNYGSNHGDLYKPDSMDMGGGRGNGKDFNMADFEAMKQPAGGSDLPDRSRMPGTGGKDFGGMGGSGASLQYIDDDLSGYSTILDSAKTDVTDADQTRLIASLKSLSEGRIEEAVDVEAALRYFVVHNYVVNGDSYTGSMIHNYYLYEEDGKLAMIPWDYNLAFGTFQGADANSAVNDALDAPLSVTGSGDRPMADWIFQNEEYTALYHQYLSHFLASMDIDGILTEAAELIAPYVENDPTAFCTYPEFESGVSTLREFCALRSESLTRQLAGSTEPVDASHLNLSDLGTMHVGSRTAMPANAEARPQTPVPGSREIPENSTFPGGMPPEAPQESFAPAELNTRTPGGQSGADLSTPLLLAASAVILIIGLLIAWKFKQ